MTNTTNAKTNMSLEARAEQYVRSVLKPGTDEATILAVTAKVIKAMPKLKGKMQ